MSIQKESTPAATGVLPPNHRGSVSVLSPSIAPCSLPSIQTTSKQMEGAVLRKHYSLLAHGIDSLEITIGGMVGPSKYLIDNFELWEEVKSSFISGDNYPTIHLGDRWFQLYPKSNGKYSFLLRNDEFGFIQVFHPRHFSDGAVGKQQVHIKVFSQYIHSVSNNKLIKDIYSIASFFIDEPEYLPLQISRIDVHSDWNMGDNFLTEGEVKQSICNANFRDRIFENFGVEFSEKELELMNEYRRTPSCNKGSVKLTQELMDKMVQSSINQFSIGADRMIGGRDLQTAYFGNHKISKVYGRIYDKTAQIKKETSASFIKEIWLENGYNGIDKVGRVEFGMKRAFIKELDNGAYVNLQDFISNIGKVWEYLTSKFLRLVVARKENNLQLSEVSLFWSKVQSAFVKPLASVIRKKDYSAKMKQLYLQALGCLKQAVSVGMITNEDTALIDTLSSSLLDNLLLSYHNGEILERRKLLGRA